MGRSALAEAAARALERAASAAPEGPGWGFTALQRGLYRSLLTTLAGRPLPVDVLAGAAWPGAVDPGFTVGDVAELGRIHEELKDSTPRWEDGGMRLEAGPHRRISGAFYTPPALVEHLLDTALEPVLGEVGGAVRVCDPTCGNGLFLVAALRRISPLLQRRGGTTADAVGCVRGFDADPVAVDLARAALWVEAGCPDDAGPCVAAVRVGDALRDDWSAGFDVVVGNPPFLNQLSTETTLAPSVRSRFGVAGTYADVSALILLRSLDLVRPGGRIALVQPQSLLAARDAGPVRRAVLARACLANLWASDVPVFADTPVLTCAPTLVVGGEQGPVSVTHGPSFEPMRPVPASERLESGWSFLLAEGLGVPAVRMSSSGVLGDIAVCTADFRDEYYGLVPYVADGSPDAGHVRLVTSGLIDPAASRWGERPARFAKQRLTRPVVDLDRLRAESPLGGWAGRRLVPKVLVATQTRVLEAVVDEDGTWLPSVPVLSVVPGPERLWHVLAVLCAPPMTAYAATHWAGTGLSMRGIKLSATQLASLPLPARASLWDEGAALAGKAQHASSPAAREEHLRDLAQVMTAAYAAPDEVLEWWLDRARLRP